MLKMIRAIAILAVALFMAQCAPATAATCPAVFAGGKAPVTPVAIILVCHTEYEAAYAPAWGEPAYVAEHLTADQARAGEATKRNGAFHVEDQLPASERISPSLYAKTGFDLGHMAPAGDFGADKPESFSTVNMVPQRGALNRVGWAHMERYVRGLAIEQGELYVMTGPEIAADAPRLGSRVSVPSKTWKALWSPKQGAGAYVCTNTAQPVCIIESIDALAAEIGFDPFPAISDTVKAQAMALPAVH